MDKNKVARQLVKIAKDIMGGRSVSVRFIFRPKLVYKKLRMTESVWKSRQSGKPTSQNIKRYVEMFNSSLEPDGANSQIGRGGAIYGGEIFDYELGEVVAEWEDNSIIRFYKSKPKFEVY